MAGGTLPVSEARGRDAARPDGGEGRCAAASCVAARLGLACVPPRYHDDFPQELERAYPLPADIIWEGVQPGNVSRMGAFLDKLARGAAARVLVIGGSFTMGSGCQDDLGREKQDCSWVARLRRWLQAAFPRSSVVFYDESRAGQPIGMFLSGLGALFRSRFLPEEPPDIVFIDTMANDGAWAQVGLASITRNVSEYGSVAFEQAVIALRTLAPHAQIILLQDGCRPCLAAGDMQMKVARHYNIPTANYGLLVSRYNRDEAGADRLWPNSDWDEDAWVTEEDRLHPVWLNFYPRVTVKKRNFGYPTQHPPWPVHQYLADLVALVVLDGLERACAQGRHGASIVESFPEPGPGATFWPQGALGAIANCIHPLTHYSAEDARAEGAPTVQSGNWRLFEDVPGKPGWIASEEDSVILFPILLGGGGSAALTISWLASYEGVGDAEARIYSASNWSDTSKVALLNGFTPNFSQAQTGF